MELEVMELTAEEVKLVKCYRAMTETDQKLCLFLAARFNGELVSNDVLSNVNVIFHVGDNSSHNALMNIQSPK